MVVPLVNIGRRGMTPRPAAGTILILCFALLPLENSHPAFAQNANPPVIVRGEPARRMALDQGFAVEGTTADGRAFALKQFVNGRPQFYITENSNAAISVGSNHLYPGGSAGLSLTGQGVTLGVWDAGRVRTTHQELTGRATQRDGATSLHFHATHVAGTMIASGASASARGMSYQALLDCYDWNNDDPEMDAAAGAGLRVSNHSYGLITGWLFDPGFITPQPVGLIPVPISGWWWFGDVTVSTFEDHFFGYYSFEAEGWDQISFDNPRYLWVKSAGNDRNEGPNPGTSHYYYEPTTDQWTVSNATRSKDGNNGYDSISHSAIGKNGLTIGAVNDVPGGYSGPSSVVMSSFSCWGPADDGRIKPDIVGNGISLFSTLETSNVAYGSLSGTSMSSPNVSGSLGLLIQHWRDTHPGEMDMLSSTLKGLIIHTADECGATPGPDYVFGWGLLNTRRAAELITIDVDQELAISEQTLDGDFPELSFTVISSADADEVRVTICWTDPPPLAPMPYVLDPTTPALVNDLDLRIERIDGEVFMPWVLNGAQPALAATRGDNTVDNVEQVVAADSGAQAYTVCVTHKGMLHGGSQTFSLLVSGAETISLTGESIPPQIIAQSPPPGTVIAGLPQVSITFDEPVKNVTPADLRVNGIVPASVTGSGAGPYVFTGIPKPANGAVVVDVRGGMISDAFDNPFPGLGWNYTRSDCDDNGQVDSLDIALDSSRDCNRNGVIDDCDPAALRLKLPGDIVIPFGQITTLAGPTYVSGGKAPLTFQWTLRGNSTQTETSEEFPEFRPMQPGVYVVRVVVTDAQGCTDMGFIRVDVMEGDLAGPLPPTVVTVGGPFCPFGGGMALASMVAAFAGRRWMIRRRRRGD